MIARLDPATWDCEGRPIGQPRKALSFCPTFPMEAYLTQALRHRCNSLESVRAFLRTCRYVKDDVQFRRDYWMPPEEFEERRQGDCDCASIWAWRQLIEMGIEARYVLGSVGSTDRGHAWVTYREAGEWYLLEPFAARAGASIPRLMTLSYSPRLSVGYDGEHVRYFEHTAIEYRLRTLETTALIAESAWFYTRLWIVFFSRLPQWMFFRWQQKRRRLRHEPQRDVPAADHLLLRSASVTDLDAIRVDAGLPLA